MVFGPQSPIIWVLGPLGSGSSQQPAAAVATVRCSSSSCTSSSHNLSTYHCTAEAGGNLASLENLVRMHSLGKGLNEGVQDCLHPLVVNMLRYFLWGSLRFLASAGYAGRALLQKFRQPSLNPQTPNQKMLDSTTLHL